MGKEHDYDAIHRRLRLVRRRTGVFLVCWLSLTGVFFWLGVGLVGTGVVKGSVSFLKCLGEAFAWTAPIWLISLLMGLRPGENHELY